MNKFDWGGYNATMLPLRVAETQRRHNAIVNACLDIMRLTMCPAGVTENDLVWWRWLRDNPVRQPKWRMQ